MSDALRLAVRDLLGIEPTPSPADELYLRLSADPEPAISELWLVADQLGDARAILAESRSTRSRPAREYDICHLCGATDRPLVYNLPKAGFADRPVCDDDARCDARAERAWLVLARRARPGPWWRGQRRLDALRRWQAEMAHRGRKIAQPVVPAVPAMPDPWSGTLRHHGNRAHLLHRAGSHRMLSNGERPSHLIGAR